MGQEIGVKMPERMAKVNELILREVSRDLLRRLSGEFISITYVSVSRDLSLAKIWLRALNKNDELVRRANDCAADIRKALAEKIKLKRIPRLLFFADSGETKIK